eukprot:g47843.t1
MGQCTRGALKEEVKWKVSNAKGMATNWLRNNQGMRNVAIIMWELLQQRGSTEVRMQRGIYSVIMARKVKCFWTPFAAGKAPY